MPVIPVDEGSGSSGTGSSSGTASAFDEVYLPKGLAEGTRMGPVFSTVVITTKSGKEQRVGLWAQPRIQGVININKDNRAAFKALIAFYRARQGKLRGFRLRDWTDYDALDQPCLSLSSSTLQLIKEYAAGVQRPIRKPVVTSVILKRSGTIYTSYTLDASTGIVTLTGATSGTFTWSGQFDIPVRFDTDKMDVLIANAIVQEWTAIPIVEVI